MTGESRYDGRCGNIAGTRWCGAQEFRHNSDTDPGDCLFQYRLKWKNR